MRFEKLDDAVHAWVAEFNRFPTDMIDTLMKADPDSWCEVSTPSVGDRVYVCEEDESGEVISVRYSSDDEDDEELYEVKLDNQETVFAHLSDLEIEFYDRLPMWGAMWQFGDPCDEHWIEEEENRKKMSGCGFRIYHHEEWGYFFGIDGAGYSFYEAHWIPLYKARGLEWHHTE